MEKAKRKCANLAVQNQQKIYAFLSKTIYDELIEFGADQEYIFPFSFYLHWAVLRKYGQISKKRGSFKTIEILRNIEIESEEDKDDSAQYISNFVDTVFENDLDGLISIYSDIYQDNGRPLWLGEWCDICEFCFETSNDKIKTCLILLKIVNESLSIGDYVLSISLNILVRIQKYNKL